VRRRAFLGWLAALGPGLALARAGLGDSSVTAMAPWITLTTALERFYDGQFVTVMGLDRNPFLAMISRMPRP
jgi:hypothetical protein